MKTDDYNFEKKEFHAIDVNCAGFVSYKIKKKNKEGSPSNKNEQVKEK